jgi:hypothetical protein
VAAIDSQSVKTAEGGKGRGTDGGERVKVRTAQSGDPYDRMVDGRTATIEKILHDVDDKLYFAVTIDGPGQELLRETGRHQFFFAGEVEPL